MLRTRYRLLLLLAAVGLRCLTPASAHAGWPSDPNVNVPLCTAANDQLSPTIVSDGAGGAIVTWYDYRSGTTNADIYVQRVDAVGVPQWTLNGVALCTAANNQLLPKIASDGAGGAIVTWEDHRSGNADIYAQRVNALGVPQWTADGVALCTALNDQVGLTIASDVTGGAIITWDDRRSGTNWDIYAQRVNAAGVPQWTADGSALCTAANDQLYPTIASDGAGGAIVTWYDGRSGPADIYAQRVNAAGVPQWTANGVAVCTAPLTQEFPVIASDGAGGAIVTWEDDRNENLNCPDCPANWDIYAQRVNAAGVPQWTADGVTLCNGAPNVQFNPTIASDGAGGAIVTWQDSRRGTGIYDIYAQRVNAAGVPQWAVSGVALCTARNGRFVPTIASDGAGGAIVTWEDLRNVLDPGNPRYDIYAQRVNAAGVPQWTADGVAVCTAPDNQQYPAITSDGAGGAIVTWQDSRSLTSWDIYAQNINADGSLGGGFTPTTIALVDARTVQGRVELRWFGSSMAGVAATVYRQTAQAAWTAVASIAGDGTGMLVYADVDVRPGTRYGYRLGLREGGVEKFYGETWVSVPPLALTLEGLRPNPAVGEPAAAFTLPSGAPARLQLLDVTGRVRLSREVGTLGAGSHVVGLGGSVPAGIYWVRLTQSGRSLLAQGVVVK